MKKLLSLIALLSSFIFLSFGEDPDFLHGREFTASLSETRNGVVQKRVLQDFLKFKNGKVQSDFLRRKYGFKYIRYRINEDTSYVDETGTPVRRIKLLASATDENNLTVQLDLTSLEWDLDGTIRITKNDKLRKFYDLSGREKGGKPPKRKEEKEQLIEENI